MKLPDGTTLLHERAPYDPAAAREYYLRTRKLKGRKKGSGEPTSFTVKGTGGKVVKLNTKQMAEQRAIAAERVTSIKKKLSKLNSELKKLVAEARQKEQKSKRSAKDANKPDSASEKAEAARDAKKYREKNQQQLKSKAKQATSGKKDSKSKPDTVAELKSVIADVKKNLAAAVDKQRSLTTAKKNG